MTKSNNGKGCMCDDLKHNKVWHCIARKAGVNLVADFPFENPPTKDTGLWGRKEFHKIRNWGIDNVFESEFITVKRCVVCNKPYVRKHTCKKLVMEMNK